MAVICERFDTLGQAHPDQTYALGIMGGTFDPIHLGHLAVAEQARDVLRLDAVVFMPAGRQPYKLDQEQLDPKKRLEMCRLAVEDNPDFDVSPLEVERCGITYTIDTLKTLRAHYPDNVKLYFIAGADSIATLADWKDARELSQLASFVGINRPGTKLAGDKAIKKSLHEAGFTVEFIHAPSLDISSTDLRRRIAQGGSIRYLIPESVRQVIEAENLYHDCVEVSAL